MNEESARIIDRIKKLLRLSRSPNPHEAALALERALALAQANSISLASVDPDSDSGKIRHSTKPEARLHFEKERALILIKRHFNVDTIRGWDHIIFIGHDADIHIAEYAYDYIVRACRACLKTYEAEERAERRKVSKNKRRNYIYGFMIGIDTNLEKLRSMPDADPGTRALVHATLAMEKRRREAYMVGTFRNIKTYTPATPERHNQHSIVAGMLDGRKTNILRPVTGSSVNQPMLLEA